MRDIIITLLVFGAMPFILTRPHIGVIMWSWLGFMNPHRLTWGFAYNFPFAQAVGIATLVGVLLSKERKQVPWTALTITWILFIVWMNLTTIFAIYPGDAFQEWDRTMKIMLFSFVTILVMAKPERINALVWTIVFSLGFFGVKGGIFAVLTGGNYRVYGPEGSFIEDNNALALALIMILPLMRYLQIITKHRLVYWGFIAAMGLTALSILSSHSRGAFLAGASMVIFLWLKSQHKLWMGIALLVIIPALLSTMPEKWFDRMDTIETYEEDSSAMGRINAWWFAYNLAKDRPLIGGGFQTFSPELFLLYAPDPEDFHDSHSIYFEVLAEQGFIGLALFLTLGILAFRTGTRIIHSTRDNNELLWAYHLAAMLQVSLVGYAVGGAFLGLAYFDLYYSLIALLVLLRLVIEKDITTIELTNDDNDKKEISIVDRGASYDDFNKNQIYKESKLR